MIENHGLIEYLLRSGGDLSDRESLTARQIKRFTDEMPGGFFIYRDDDDKILYVNYAVLQMLGCKTEEEFWSLTGGTGRRWRPASGSRFPRTASTWIM